jgi:hypothetical protein
MIKMPMGQHNDQQLRLAGCEHCVEMGLDRRPGINDHGTLIGISDHPRIAAIQRHWTRVGSAEELDVSHDDSAETLG